MLFFIIVMLFKIFNFIIEVFNLLLITQYFQYNFETLLK